MRTSKELRITGLISFFVVLALALGIAFLVYILFGRVGRLSFNDWNVAGVVEALIFVIAFSFGQLFSRRVLNLPTETLLSAGLITPMTADKAATPIATNNDPARIDLSEMVAVLIENGQPVALQDSRENRTVPWDKLVKVKGNTALSDVKPLLIDQPFVIVVKNNMSFGLITRDIFLQRRG